MNRVLQLRSGGASPEIRHGEQGAVLESHDSVASHEQGIRDLLDALGEALEREAATASHPQTRAT
jgi:hypothetical protein